MSPFPPLRYVERNPVRAGLVRRAEQWPWSSARDGEEKAVLGLVHEWPVERPGDWRQWVNLGEGHGELGALRNSVNRGAPYGSEGWVLRAARKLGLEASVHPRGRPKKKPQEK